MIDLRSDTVSQPTSEMRAVMAAADVGDDVYGDDPTVNALQEYAADLLGKEAALFVTSGTQSNLCALLAHCGRGDEYIAGNNAHAFKYEGGGAAVLGSIQPQTVAFLPDGTVDLEQVKAVVKPDDHHFARTRLLCLENTHDGKAQSVAQMHEAATVGRSLGLAMHLDGARLWNAAIDENVAPADLAAPFDSVSVCLSKGLGAPMGSILVGSTDLIREAHKWRKMLGGSLRQAGIVAAAGRYALENHRDRVADDHANALALGKGLAEIDRVRVDAVNTNMVFATFAGVSDDKALVDALASQGISIVVKGGHSRMVTHLGVDTDAIDTVVEALAGQLST